LSCYYYIELMNKKSHRGTKMKNIIPKNSALLLQSCFILHDRFLQHQFELSQTFIHIHTLYNSSLLVWTFVYRTTGVQKGNRPANDFHKETLTFQLPSSPRPSCLRTDHIMPHLQTNVLKTHVAKSFFPVSTRR